MAENSAPRVFVSHHSSKHSIAEQAEALLAERGIRCWIAPRDVPPGAPFDTAIQTAINECAAVLLLFCANSDKSRHVKRELILGDSAGRPIIPLRLEAIDPGELAYHLADSQWIDWVDGREAVMDRVAAQVRLYAGAPAALADDVAILGKTAEIDHSDAAQKKWAIPALIGALAIALVFVAVLALRSGDTANGDLASADVDAGVTEVVETPSESETPSDTEAEPTQPPPSQAERPSGFTAPQTATPTPSPTSTRPERAPTQIAAAPDRAERVSDEPLRRVVQACAGAATDTEYLICSSPALESRAREMSQMIRDIRSGYEASGESASAFNTQQRQWFNGMKASCSSAACVEARQRARLGELQQVLASIGD